MENKTEKVKAKVKPLTTTKRLKICGSTKLYQRNEITGELEEKEAGYIEVEDRDFNFNKIWLGHIFEALDLLGGAKVKVAMWILENRDIENNVIASIREIAEKCGVSLKSAFDTIKILKNADIVRQIKNGIYKVNPNVIFKGSYNRRMNVLISYGKTERQLPGIENEENQIKVGDIELEEKKTSGGN